jgi:hypothetical protein
MASPAWKFPDTGKNRVGDDLPPEQQIFIADLAADKRASMIVAEFDTLC